MEFSERKILEILKKTKKAMHPEEIAILIGYKEATVRKRLSMMVKVGLVGCQLDLTDIRKKKYTAKPLEESEWQNERK